MSSLYDSYLLDDAVDHHPVAVTAPSKEEGLCPRLTQGSIDDGQVNETRHDLQVYNNTLYNNAINTPPLHHIHDFFDSNRSDESNFIYVPPIDRSECHHLNHSSFFELYDNRHQLLLPKERNVDVLNHKRLTSPAKFQFDNYYAQCSLLTLLEQNLATQVCLCGLKPSGKLPVNPTGLCCRPRFCYPCAARCVKKTLQTFQPNFHHHQWGFLTISFHGHLPLTHLSGSEWWLYWDAAKNALKRLVSTNVVDGAMWREELAIPSLQPTTVLPHLHAIVPTAELNPEALDRLKNWILGHRDDLGSGVALERSIDFQPIPTEEDFERVATYLLKPIDLVTPYAAKWDKDAPREAKIALNRSMRDLLEATIAHSAS